MAEKTPSGLSTQITQQVADRLTILLSDEMVVYQTLRDCHWNVKGSNFSSLHELFEQQYTQLAEIADTVAERIVQYGHRSVGTMSGFVKHSRIAECDCCSMTQEMMVEHLVGVYENLIGHLRNDADAFGELGDKASEDMAIGLIQEHLKHAWLLRSILG